MSHPNDRHFEPHALKPLSKDEETLLAEKLVKQVEFYFSEENLNKDTFLLSTLHRHHNAIPLGVIANFPRVKEIFASGHARVYVPARIAPAADTHFLASALSASGKLRVENDYIIPLHHSSPRSQSGNRVKVVVDNVPHQVKEWKLVANFFTTYRVRPAYVQQVESISGQWILDFYNKADALDAIGRGIFRWGNQTIYARLLNEDGPGPLPPPHGGYYPNLAPPGGYPWPQPLPLAYHQHLQYLQQQQQEYYAQRPPNSPISWYEGSINTDVTSSYPEYSNNDGDEDFPPLGNEEDDTQSELAATMNKLIEKVEATTIATQEDESFTAVTVLEESTESPATHPVATSAPSPSSCKKKSKKKHKKKFAHKNSHDSDRSSPATFSKENAINKSVQDMPRRRTHAEVLKAALAAGPDKE